MKRKTNWRTSEDISCVKQAFIWIENGKEMEYGRHTIEKQMKIRLKCVIKCMRTLKWSSVQNSKWKRIIFLFTKNTTQKGKKVFMAIMRKKKCRFPENGGEEKGETSEIHKNRALARGCMFIVTSKRARMRHTVEFH